MNALHTMLHAVAPQVQPILGDQFDFGSQTGANGPIGYFTAADQKTTFELTGTLEDLDRIVVVDVGEFDSGNEPETLDQMTYLGKLYEIRTLKKDASSYVLGLKNIDPPIPASP